MTPYVYDDPKTILTGQIYTDYFFGRSGYGETPEIDELEHSIFIALDEPVSIQSREPRYEGDYDSIGCDAIDRVQLAGNVNIQALRESRGHGVRVQGSLFHAHTGHHHCEVLIYLGEVQPSIIDDRNTFPNAKIMSSGTGFLLGHDALIVTAAHVVSGALGITVSRGLYRCKAVVERIDPACDLAVLRIVPSGAMREVIARREAVARPIRTWMSPQLGERVYAFGFPLRPVLPHSLNMSEGIVSAEVGIRSDRLQISAPIQRGNSGGPLFDQRGNLIGIISSKMLASFQFTPENINFAIRSRCLGEVCAEMGNPQRTEEEIKPVSPVVLAKLMQGLCVEVECWQALEGAPRQP